MPTLGLQKVIGCLLMPTGLFWMALFIAALWAWRRKQRGLGIFLFTLWMVYGVIGNRWVGETLLGSLENRFPASLPQSAAPFDAVCVLGGGTELDRALQPELNEGGDRVAAAARLWHAGKARLLVASGTSDNAFNGTRNLGQETKTLWMGMGVPDNAILVVPDQCRITREEIAAYRHLQDQMGWKRMAVISSAWHLPRVMRLASRSGLSATPVGSDSRSRARRFPGHYLVPQGEGFLQVQIACWEYLGRWVGR